jgi:CBS domain containing-hemolysin-like protein
MTQRSAVVAVPEDMDPDELVKVIKEEGYSRIPVYSDSVDKIVGILHTRNYLLNRVNEDFALSDVMIDPYFVPETIRLDSLLKDMQSEHRHMALVVNEYGHMSGIVTMEDIIEEIVGEIWDEHDVAVETIVPLGEDEYRVMSSVSIDEFFEHFSLEKNEQIESNTVNGWISEVCGNIPEVGFAFDYENLSVCVTQADEQMTHEISVKVMPVSEEEAAEDADAVESK